METQVQDPEEFEENDNEEMLDECLNCGSIWGIGSEEWDFQVCDSCGWFPGKPIDDDDGFDDDDDDGFDDDDDDAIPYEEIS